MEPCWAVFGELKNLYLRCENQTAQLTLGTFMFGVGLLLVAFYTVPILQVKVKDFVKPQAKVQPGKAKRKYRKHKRPKNKTGLQGPPTNGINTAPVGFDLMEKLERLKWVELLTWEPNVTELFARTAKITLAKAKSQLQAQFGLTAEQLSKGRIVIHMVEHSEVQWLNGHKANFGSPCQMYFKDEKDKLKSCTMACSIFGGYVVTSGHGSVEGTKYFTDRQKTTSGLVGTSIFHRCDKESDIAIIDAREKFNAQSSKFFQNSEAEVLSGSARELVEYCKENAIIHKSGQPLTGKLKFLIDKEIGVRGWAVRLREPRALESLVPGDSGALLTTEVAHNGTRSVKAIGLLSLKRRIRTTKTEIPFAVAFPLGPCIESFCQEKGISSQTRQKDGQATSTDVRRQQQPVPH